MDDMFIKKDESMLVIIPLGINLLYSLLKGFGYSNSRLFYGLMVGWKDLPLGKT